MSEATAPAAPAPAAPAALSTSAAPNSSAAPEPKPVGRGGEANVTQPPAEQKPPPRKEVRAKAAKELLAELTRRREDAAKPEPKEPAPERKDAKEAPKQSEGDKGKPEPKEGPQRGQDGRFAGKPGEAKPESSKAPESAPQQPARPDNGETEQRLSRVMRELNSKTAEAETHSRTAKELKAKVDQYEAREAQRKKDNNPLDILSDYGWDLDSVARAVVEKGLRPRNMRTQVPDEVRQELDGLKAFKDRFEQAERQQAAQRARNTDVKTIGDYVKANAEQYPYTAALGWSAGVIADNTRAAKQADATEQLLAFERSMAETTLGLVGNEQVFKALLKSKPELKEQLAAWLGVSTSKEADPPVSKQARDNEGTDGPRSLDSVPTGQAPKPKTRRESKRAAVRDFDSEWRASRNG